MGAPGDAVGLIPERAAGIAKEAQHAECGAGERGQPLGQAGAARPVTIFVPPAVLDEEEAVLDLPMAAHMRQQLRVRRLLGIKAGDEVARIAVAYSAIVGDDVAVNAQADLAAGKAQGVADVSDVV